MRAIKLLILLVSILIVFTSCQDDPTSLGKDFIDSEVDIIVIDSREDSLNQNTSSFVTDSSFYGASFRLVLGNIENVKSTMLMRFALTLPDSIRTSLEEDNLTVLSAETILKPTYRIGDEGAVNNFTVHRITSSWTSTRYNSDSLALLSYEATELTSSKEISDSLIKFELDNEVALDWMKSLLSDSLAKNYGMVFIPQTGVNKAYGFRAFPITTADDSPIIRYIVENENNKLDTLDATVRLDVHVVEGTATPVANDRFQLTAGLAERGKLYFDLSSIPEYANINRAELTLQVDSVNSKIGNIKTDSLRIHLFSDSSSHKLNSNYRIQRIVYNDGIFFGDISNTVQAILLGAENQGFSLSLGNEAESLDRYVLYGSSYSDPALRPQLKIYYNVSR